MIKRSGWFTLLLLLATGCAQEMMNQKRLESQEKTSLFPDSTASQSIPEHTIIASLAASKSISVAQMQPSRRWIESANVTDDEGYLSGKIDGELVNAIPARVLQNANLKTLILRGQNRFAISCVPCHGKLGNGNGMVAQRGFMYPPSYHSESLRSEPLGYIFNVITNGRGQMAGYGDYLSTDDRWAIAAYVRTLQFSQYASQSLLAESDMTALRDNDTPKAELGIVP